MRTRLLVLLSALAVAGLAACNLTTEQDLQTLATATAITGGKPIVTITAPKNGDEVVVGAEVLVSAVAADSVGVQRVQLLANGQIVKTVSSESPSGDTTLNVLLDYTPRDQGDVNLQVIAFRGAVSSDPAQITVRVRSNVSQVTSTAPPVQNVPQIDPNDPTCRALVNIGLNLRTGPSTDYERILVLPAGSIQPIVGRIGSNQWWQVRVGNNVGWVSAQYTTVYGICTNVPIQTPPATPTSRVPTSTPLPIPPTFAPPTIAPPATATSSPPDLIIANIGGPLSLTIPSGSSQVVGSYAVTISNIGGAGTGQFSNVVIRTPGNVEIPVGAVSGLEPNQSIVLPLNVTFDAVGSYSLQARADSGSAIAESNEGNNVSNFNLSVTSG